MTVQEILAQVASGKLSPADAAGLMPSNGAASPLRCKVSEKGALSVYGLQKMPVTLYAGQWERLSAYMPELMAFLAANDAALSRKA